MTATVRVKPYEWPFVSGSLSNVLTLDAATGIISGKPISLGPSSFTIQLMDDRKVAVTKGFNLVVK